MQVVPPAVAALATPDLHKSDFDDGPADPLAAAASSDSEAVMAAAQVVFGPVPCVPDLLEGGILLLEDRQNTWGYFRYKLQCRRHPNCKKHHNANRDQCKMFGLWGPLLYLAVWQQFGDKRTAAQHQARDLHIPQYVQRDWLTNNGHI